MIARHLRVSCLPCLRQLPACWLLVCSVSCLQPAREAPKSKSDHETAGVAIKPLEPIWDFYTGVLLEVRGPRGNIFWLWPQEYWSWITEEGQRKGDFIQGEFVRDFRQDPQTGTIHYNLTMAPRDCDIRVEVVPGPDTLTIVHRIANRGSGTVLGGSPCLQIGHARDFQSWTFEQAKRTFLWTVQNKFTWLSDTRRTGKDVHPDNKPFCQNYHFSDPKKMHGAFGRSPDLAASGVIGSVSTDQRFLVACVSENAQSVAHGLMNCLHSSLDCRTGPGEEKAFRYRIYFLANDIEQLGRRVQNDFPSVAVLPADRTELILSGQSPPLESFEDEMAYARLAIDRGSIEPTVRRRLTVEGGAAPTYGITHGQGAALCELQDGGSVTVPALFVPDESNRYFSVDLTVPEDQTLTIRLSLTQQTRREEAEFAVSPGATRRCVLPLGTIGAGDPVSVTLAAEDGKACLIQMDALSLY